MTLWSKEEDEIIFKYYGVSPVSAWSNLLPKRSYDAIISRAQRLGLSSALNTAKSPVPVFEPGLEDSDEMDFDELWEAIYAFQKSAMRLSTRKDSVSISLETDSPIGVCFIADVHIGAVSTPYDIVRSRFATIASYPWLYPIGAGDKIDNYLPGKHPQGMFDVMFPPELQKELVNNLYSKLKGRWLALCQGCHDDFSHQTDDFDFTKYMAHELGCANLGYGGEIKLKVGDISYNIVVRHKYRYNSSMNYTHTCKRLRERQYPMADIVCVAHNHVTTLEHQAHNDKDRIYIRPGTMKHPDRYARSMGYTGSDECLPVVILHPDERRMEPFLSLERAQVVLDSL